MKYPILRNALRISHGIERQELNGCCWMLKAEMSNEKVRCCLSAVIAHVLSHIG